MDPREQRDQLLLENEQKESQISVLGDQIKRLVGKQNELRAEVRALNHRMNLLPLLINVLPNEVLHTIFKKLSLSDLLSCARTCTRWYINVSDMKIPSLIISDPESKDAEWPRLSKCSYNWQSSIDASKIKPDLPSYLEMKLVKYLLVNLKELKICVREDRTLGISGFEFIVELKALKNLEVINQISRFVFDFSQIRSISLESLMITANFLIKLNAPFLANFHTMSHSLRYFDFFYPKSLRTLRMPKYSTLIVRFTNLEKLFVDQDVVSLNVLDEVPKLSVLSFANSTEFFEINYETAKETALRVLDQVKQLNRRKSCLSLFFFGIKLDDSEQLENCEYKHFAKRTVVDCSCRVFPDGPSLIALHMQNYSKLADDLTWVSKINYSDLVDWLDGNIRSLPADFFDKFSAIREVCVNGEANESELLDFLTNCKNLNRLTVQHSRFKESFYIKFAVCFPFVRQLSVKCSTRVPDYRFIQKLHAPTYLSFDDVVPLDIICWSLERFVDLIELKFKIIEKKACITKSPTGFKLFIEIPSYPKSFEKLDQLMFTLKRMKNYFMC